MTKDQDLEVTAKIIASYVSFNSISAGDMEGLIAGISAALLEASKGRPPVTAIAPVPAVSIKKSITLDHLICLDDGIRFRSLKRHLKGLGMTPDEYRAKWGLPASYPMAAPSYSARRSIIAKSIGLGHMRGTAVAGKAKKRTK